MVRYAEKNPTVWPYSYPAPGLSWVQALVAR